MRLARHAVAQLAARLRSSAEIAVLLMGPAFAGLLAFAALPAMLAASYPLTLALPLLLAHGVAMSLPFLLLQPLVAPVPQLAWMHGLPIPPGLLRRSSMLLAAVLAAPLALAYCASLTIWLTQRPDWLIPARALAGTLLSLLVSWACGAWLLLYAVRQRAPRKRPATAASRAGGFAPARARARGGMFYLWRQLFWLPLWRNGSQAGPRLALLLAGAIAAICLWMLGPAALPRPAGAVAASILVALLAHDAGNIVRAQLATLAPNAAGWPLRFGALAWRARAAALLPSLLAAGVLSCAGQAAQAWMHAAGRFYLLLAIGVPPLLIATPPFTPRGRMALFAFCTIVLCATGSEIWT